MADRLTRFDADLVESAVAEGKRQRRSGRQQLEHWALVGRAVSAQRSVARSRVEAALAGRLPLSELNAEEGAVFNAEVAAGVAERIARVDIGAELAARGIVTVALDEEGNLVEYHPDGSIVRLDV